MTDIKEKVSKKKVIIILLVALLASAITLFAVFYIWKTNFYKSHFLPNTYVNGVDCSEMEASAVAEFLEEDARKYELTILGRDENGNQIELGAITAEDINLTLKDGEAAVQELLSQQYASNWLLQLLNKDEYNFQLVYVVEFDEKALENKISSLDAFNEETMIKAADAYISDYSPETNSVEIVPEVIGTELDVELAYSSIKTAVIGNGNSIDLVEMNCYKEPAVLATDAQLISDAEQINKWLGTEITYDWNTFEVIVNGNLIKDWILREEDGVKLDEGAIASFVATNAGKYDTYGKSRRFVTTLGVEVSLANGGFGWQTDREKEVAELTALINDGAVTKKEPVYSYTAPQRGMYDIGNTYLEADITNQHVYFYQNGVMVFETDMVSGAMNTTPDCVTPPGLFDVNFKTTNVVMKGVDYEYFCYYWVPYYGNYGLHDATWRDEFGGDIYLTNGSHGCLNLPLESAATLYNYLYTGCPIICYYY